MEPHVLLESYLTRLHLSAVAAQYRQIAADAARDNLSYERFLLAWVEHEVQHRDAQRRRQRIRAAHFPVLKELADFDFSLVPTVNKQQILELAQGHYIAKAEPILLVGNPGLGKTHLATGLALAACRQGQRVRFYTAAELVNALSEAQDERRLGRVIAQARKQQVIVLDELGFIPFSTLGAQLVFQYCSALHERVSLILTTNLRFADWTQVFGNEQMTVALLDRLTYRGHIVELVGESYRFRSRLQHEADTGAVG